ncbi:hypothetical protein F5887DRAFT_55355 [Amanita rubescens]|nr:hypothetical protein F5887DRAFT_55355 [Amanita rubescens]
MIFSAERGTCPQWDAVPFQWMILFQVGRVRRSPCACRHFIRVRVGLYLYLLAIDSHQQVAETTARSAELELTFHGSAQPIWRAVHTVWVHLSEPFNATFSSPRLSFLTAHHVSYSLAKLFSSEYNEVESASQVGNSRSTIASSSYRIHHVSHSLAKLF